VWRLEAAKLHRQARVQAVLAVCLLAPFLLLVAVKVQGTLPSDTLFGQWLHTSGFALPMVMVAFLSQWVLPLIAAVIVGDTFSSEDHFGTWKTVLTRSRTRGQLYTGKVLAAFGYTVAALVLLAGASLAAGVLLGTQPVVGLTGQPVGAGTATRLVLASWATELPPLLGFAGLAVLLSILSRHSVVGIGLPVLIAVAMALSSLLDLPGWLRAALLTTPLQAWHGLWVQDRFYGPLREGLITSGAWLVASLAVSWFVFRRRSFAVT
jgi:ABC-2 type transport system permease protein